MNRSSTRQKRSIGKSSPLSKRPKLDFTLRSSRDSFNDSRDFSTNGSCEKGVKDPNGSTNAKSASHGTNLNGNNSPAEPDWDDEFSGDMLEKVCLIADLSQAMANNQVGRDRQSVDKSTERSYEGQGKTTGTNTESGSKKSRTESELDELRMKYQELQERFKTKEGEVHILRSQLKQNEDTKQAVALQNIKVMDEIHKKYNEKLSSTEKELETVKTKLQFKDMEYKTLSERCRQLEFCMPRAKACDGNATQVDGSKALTQVVSQRVQGREDDAAAADDSGSSREGGGDTADSLGHGLDDIQVGTCHEGQRLRESLCPELFEPTANEPTGTFLNCHRRTKSDVQQIGRDTGHDRPKQTVFLRDVYDPVSQLFGHETFTRMETRRLVETILDRCLAVLSHAKDVLLSLEKLHLHNGEHDDSDESLLDNEDEVDVTTVKMLLRGSRLGEEEREVEARRTLALVHCLMQTSQVACDFLVRPECGFVAILKVLASSVGNLRRPLRYKGLLLGISFVLQRLLQEENLTREIVQVANSIVEEVIFSRPKLDVLIEVVNALRFGRNHFEFLSALCRKASLDSCSLYMDSKLKQAMFFTKNACPLKLLCMQMMGLACLPSSRKIRWNLADSVIGWLNASLNTAQSKQIKWLPVNFSLGDEDRCYDVTECLPYLLTLCLKDYLTRFFYGGDCEDEVGSSGPGEPRPRSRRDLISIIGRGSLLLKRILKTDQRQLHDNWYSVRFAVLLNTLLLEKNDIHQRNLLGPVELDAITWLTDSLESDLRNQDCYTKQSTSAMSDIDMISALTIDGETKIY